MAEKILHPTARVTRSVRKEDVAPNWWVIDAEGKTLGRLATQVAHLMRGKHKPDFTPHVDGGDFVVVVNADKVVLTGKRESQKEYFRHTGYPGGGIFTKYRDAMQTKPEFVIRQAVWGMIPKHRLGRRIIKKLKVYRGADHPHSAQKPQQYELPYTA